MKKVISVLILLLLTSPAVFAQAAGEEDKDSLIQITPKKDGWDIAELFTTISEYTGQSIVFDPASPQIRGRKIEFVGTQTVPRDRLFEWFQSLLSFQRLVLVPVGPTGHEQWMALDLNAPQITNRPIFVAEDDILNWADRDGVYIVSTITVQNLTDTSRARNAVAQLSTRQIGRINDVPGNLAFVVGDFAPVVASMYRLLKAMDKEPLEYKAVPETYMLENAVASEVEPILIDLLQTNLSGRPSNRPQAQPGIPSKPEPQIIADTRQDAIIVFAVREDQEQIAELIRLLDQKVVYKRGNINIRAIKHTDALELADLLTDLIRGIDVPGRQPNRGQPNRGQPSSPGQLSGNQTDPVIVADERSNSLLIQATPTQLIDIMMIIDQIDIPRDQVLVEAALIELSVDDLIRLGVELVSATNQKDLDERTFFGATQFGLSTITDIDDDGIPDINIPTFGQGITAGIYDNKRFPVILQALQTSGSAQALSMPSVVVEDGSQATMLVSEEEPYTVRSTDNAGNSNFTVEFVQAEISLDISPHISSDNYLRLHIIQKVQSFGARASEDLPPPKTNREIETDIVIPDGYTVIMGGLIDQKQQETDSGVPYLRDIPILGYLFGASTNAKSSTSLFLFVTPHILHQGAQGDFDEYLRATWNRKLLADDLLQKAVDIPNSRFTNPDNPDRLDKIQNTGYLDMPRFKAPPRTTLEQAEADKRFEELTKPGDKDAKTGGEAQK